MILETRRLGKHLTAVQQSKGKQMETDNIDGTTRLFVIIGDPISAVRTPAVFNEMFGRQGVNAVFVAHHVAADDLNAAWAGLKTIKNLDGIVITMPHKTAMCGLVDSLGVNGRVVGAINAARRKGDGSWEGDMFDGVGCVAGLAKQKHEVAGKDVFLMGLGGAGAAVASALAQAGVRRLVVADLNTERRDRVINSVRAACPQLAIEAGELSSGPFDVVINATPLGMREGDPLPFDPAPLPVSTLVVDVITKPEMTPLLLAAKASGHRTHTGKHMHRGQAVSVAKFFGFDLDA